MLKIKKLYIYIIQAFIPVFFMTFGIVLFILLMQFLWRYIEDLVGKGIDGIVLAELFSYAGLQLIPMALPLGVLLASLMTFGSKGENLELLAIKAAGVSLLKAMSPLIVLVALITVGSFYFQNEVMPTLNVKTRTLLISIKRKSPELDIPEGSFYNGINNYSLFVKRKDRETKMLHDVMIYDTSEGFDNMAVFVCDSAHMTISQAKDFLLLDLYSGQRFANFRQGILNSSRDTKFVPYGRENFKKKQIIISFNSDFNRLDESIMEGTQLSKNIVQLGYSIDSMHSDLDSLNIQDRISATQSIRTVYEQDTVVKQKPIKLEFDSVLNSYNHEKITQYFNSAIGETDNAINSFMYRPESKGDLQKNIRYHEIEWHKKFTQAVACLIFFFIGAPLGAIVRKGGLGMPVVISVGLFIVYYIFENTGTKMARDGVWEVWQGVWFSTFMLLPLGVFLTYKAMNDSALFNTEAYTKYLRKILRIKTNPERTFEKEIDPSTIRDLRMLNADKTLIDDLSVFDNEALKDIAKNHQQYGYDDETLEVVLSILKDRGASFFDIRIQNLDYTESKRTLLNFGRYSKLTLFFYFYTLLLSILWTVIGSDFIALMSLIANIAYLVFFVKTCIYYYDFYQCIDRKTKNSEAWLLLFALFFNFIFFFYFKSKMKEDMNNIKW